MTQGFARTAYAVSYFLKSLSDLKKIVGFFHCLNEVKATIMPISTGQCREGICDKSGKWQFVEAVPRLDEDRQQSFTHGWIYSRYTQQIVCP
jgi:hypothetical protein